MIDSVVTCAELAQNYAEQMAWLPNRGLAFAAVTPNIDAAIEGWSAAIGRDFVLADEATRREYARTTLPRRTTPAAILRPSTTEEVQQVVRIAAKYGIKCHAVSRGKNWGYGDACAPTDGQAIIELKRLNRIREVNAELAYAVIEAGVSQGQLFEHLRKNDVPLMMDVTGAGPEASIVGNILQRGFGHTPYGDRVQHCARLEVVLPDGNVLYTGFAGSNPQAAHVYRWGLGPSVDGLFVQSQLGIVTALTLWLMPAPRHVEAFGVELQDDSELCRAIAILRQRMLEGTLSSTVHIANDHRVQQHTARDGPLAGGNARLAPWSICGGIYGDLLLTRALKRVLRRSFRGVGRVRFFNGRSLGLVRRMGPLLRCLPQGRSLLKKAGAVQTVYSLLCGEPAGAHLTQFLRRHETTSAEAGLIWVSPVIPAASKPLLETLAVVRNTFAEFAFPPQITLSFVNPRTLVMVTSVTFEKQSADETRRASECAAAVRVRLERIGIYPYRTSSVE